MSPLRGTVILLTCYYGVKMPATKTIASVTPLDNSRIECCEWTWWARSPLTRAIQWTGPTRMWAGPLPPSCLRARKRVDDCRREIRRFPP
jgi:hypothetical protein